MNRRLLLMAVWMLLCGTTLYGSDDVVVADFEAKDYGEWKVVGEAFGPGPAKGTLPGQMHVSGFNGERLVNSFFKGDGSTGTLTSPPFKVERNYLSFLIGGGGDKDKTCLNLLHDGKVVRSATGPNTKPGGSERLRVAFWDVSEFHGKEVVLQIVDNATGGWGHVNVDHIVLCDSPPDVPAVEVHSRTFTVTQRYLIIPIQNGAEMCELTLSVGGRQVRRYDAELATRPGSADWYAYFTIESFKGQSAEIVASRTTDAGFTGVKQANEIPGSESFYTEALRPQFHFSQKVGWNNDPNGMVYLDGEWHLFFQHNPVGWKWGNMTWGHAVSEDLIHWKQLPNKLFPKTMAQGACFSGGAVVDVKNTAGWKTGDNDVLVAFLTDTGAGESIAYSNDRGRTFTWYQGNPVVKHRGRDPKVIWYSYDDGDAPLDNEAKRLGGHWVMVVYDEHPTLKRNVAFYTSTNLKQWTLQSHLPGYFECPELFELKVEGAPQDGYWVVFAADARYALGEFDGKTFTPKHEGKHRLHYGPYYASQTFSNSPDGRRIQIGWVRLATPGMPFNQTFSFPCELTLRSTPNKVRMFAQPVAEIEKLHTKQITVDSKSLASKPVTVDVAGDVAEVRATFELGDARNIGLDIGGNLVAFDAVSKKLNDAPLDPVDGRIQLRVLVDRPMMEIFGNDGAVCVTSDRPRKGDLGTIKAFAEGGAAKLVRLEIYELKSIWKK